MWYQFILQVHDVDDKKLIEGIHKFLLAHIGICYNILVGIVVYNYTTCPWLHHDFNYWDPHNTRIFFSEKGKNFFLYSQWVDSSECRNDTKNLTFLNKSFDVIM